MNPSMRFVGENPSDAEVQVEKLYSKFETDNLQYFNTAWTACSRQENYPKMFLPLKTVGQEIKHL